MIQTPLPSDLRSRINRHAHLSGLMHAEALRTHLLDELRIMVRAGATFAAIRAYLDAMERDVASRLPRRTHRCPK